MPQGGLSLGRPRQALRRLVPAVLIASFVPDLALGVSGSSWAGVAALMVMHLGVAAVALPWCARFLPLPTGRTSPRPR